ncbi:MAG TPA: ABC transporter permease [Actinomycetota bacterium]|nr:ABC transporter permease [Actinomycetota bacterium]
MSPPGRDRLGWLLPDPWRRPRFLAVYAWLFVAWSVLPVLVAVLFSFNAGRSRSTWQGFSLRWYLSDPDLSVVHDPTLRGAVLQSLELAVLTMAVATPIGVALALGLARWRGRVSQPANLLMLLPLVTPEIVLASGLFLAFVHLYRAVPFGTPAQLLGHVTWSIPYVVVVLRGRLFGLGREYEEAAMDLGASPAEALRRVLLPLLAPAILAAFLIVFALSIDDFVTSQFLSSGEGTVTIPMLIYGTGRTGENPSLNAVATVMLVLSLGALALAGAALRSFSRRRGARASAAGELMRFEL